MDPAYATYRSLGEPRNKRELGEYVIVATGVDPLGLFPGSIFVAPDDAMKILAKGCRQAPPQDRINEYTGEAAEGGIATLWPS